MWIRIRILGDREIQKNHHKSLRPLIRELLDSKDILGFVMTYRSSNLYLCIDVPSLSDCSMNGLKSIPGLAKIVTYLNSSCQCEAPDNYLEAIKESITVRLRERGLEVPEEVLNELAKTELDSASRGCKVALDILSGNIPIEKDPVLFYETVRRECLPLTGGWIISKSSHFCFNTLAMKNMEEYAIECISTESENLSYIELSILKEIAPKVLTRLEFREPGIFQITE